MLRVLLDFKRLFEDLSAATRRTQASQPLIVVLAAAILVIGDRAARRG